MLDDKKMIFRKKCPKHQNCPFQKITSKQKKMMKMLYSGHEIEEKYRGKKYITYTDWASPNEIRDELRQHAVNWVMGFIHVLRRHKFVDQMPAYKLPKEQRKYYHTTRQIVYRLNARKLVEWSLDLPPQVSSDVMDLFETYFSNAFVRRYYNEENLVNWVQKTALEACLTTQLLKDTDEESEDEPDRKSFADTLNESDKYVKNIVDKKSKREKHKDILRFLLIVELSRSNCVDLELICDLLTDSGMRRGRKEWLREMIDVLQLQLALIEAKKAK